MQDKSSLPYHMPHTECTCQCTLPSLEMLFERKSPRFLHLPPFGSHCWVASEVTVRTPFCGTHMGNKSCRTGQHFSTWSGHSKQGDGRTGLETGLAVSPLPVKPLKRTEVYPQKLEILFKSLPSPLVFSGLLQMYLMKRIDTGTNCHNLHSLILETWLLWFHHCCSQEKSLFSCLCISLIPRPPLQLLFLVHFQPLPPTPRAANLISHPVTPLFMLPGFPSTRFLRMCFFTKAFKCGKKL